MLRGKGKLAAQLGVLSAALIMLGWGLSRGEMAVVLQKAVNICFECIGLG